MTIIQNDQHELTMWQVSVARMRSRRVILLTRNCPRLLRSQMKVKPRNLKGSCAD